jgi:hypothetical protein
MNPPRTSPHLLLKRLLRLGLAAILVTAVLFSTLGVNTAQAAGPGPAWTYQRAITINPGTPANNFQIRVQLTDLSNMVANGNDLRFYDAADVQADYWIEYWNTNPVGQATVWVEVPTAGTTSLTLYYGNASATAVSNGDSTFIAFDDFSGSSVNASKWDVRGAVSVLGGSLTVDANEQVISKTPFAMSDGVIVETVLSTNVAFGAGSRTSMNGASSLSGSGTLFTVDEPVNSQFAVWSNGRDNVYGINTIHEGDGVDNGDSTWGLHTRRTRFLGREWLHPGNRFFHWTVGIFLKFLFNRFFKCQYSYCDNVSGHRYGARIV